MVQIMQFRVILFFVMCFFASWSSFAQGTNSTVRGKATECFNRINENWRLIKMENLSFCSPFDISFDEVSGIDTSPKRYSGKEGVVEIYFGPNSPRVGGPEQKLPSYHEKSLWIDNVWTFVWQYKDEKGKLGYVSAARFYLENKKEGDAILIFISSPGADLQNQSSKVFNSVRFASKTLKKGLTRLHN
jgi:hypothetical protein